MVAIATSVLSPGKRGVSCAWGKVTQKTCQSADHLELIDCQAGKTMSLGLVTKVLVAPSGRHSELRSCYC